jgi:type IV pilus assembly protein PilP
MFLGVVPACGNDDAAAPAPAPTAPAAQPAPRGPAAPAASAAAAPATAAASVTAAEDLVVRRFRPARDPFRSVTELRRRNTSSLTHPLQQYSVQQLELLGIIWGIADPKALLRAPDKREFVIGVGTPVGTGDGKVVAILQDRVIIVERYYDYRGQLQTERYEIVLPSRGE